MNDMTYWLNGMLWTTSPTTSTNSPGSTKYWLNGMPYLDVWDTPTTPSNTSTFMFWFTF